MMMPVPVVKFDLRCQPGANITTVLEKEEATFAGSLNSPNPYHFECDAKNKGITTTKSPAPHAILETNKNISEFVNSFEANTSSKSSIYTANGPGLTVELWITFNIPNFGNPTADVRPILTIGRHQETNSSIDAFDAEDFVGCSGYEVLIAHRGRHLEISYTDGGIARTCRILLVSLPASLKGDQKLQTTLVLSAGETKVFFNGDAVVAGARNSFETNLNAWRPGYHFQLFSNYVSEGFKHFQGTIHEVAIYNQTLDVTQIRSRYQAGKKEQMEDPSNIIALHPQTSASESFVLVQGRAHELPFFVGGINASTPVWDIMVEITSLPHHGNIHSILGPVTMVGHRIPLGGNLTRTPLSYHSWPDDFFNVPSCSFSGVDLGVQPENFTYRILALYNHAESGRETIVGMSETVTSHIHVRHVNHKPILASPESVTVPRGQVNLIGSRPRAIVDYLRVLDEDQNIDRVRMDIWVYNGTLTMNEEFRLLADFDSCAGRSFSPWQCHGDGVNDRNMTFVAEPSNVELILSGLEYNGFAWDQEDALIVRVFDGSGGSCLDEQEHRIRHTLVRDTWTPNDFYSVHDECFEVSATITIPPIRGTGNKASEKDGQRVVESFVDVKDVGVPRVILWSTMCLIGCTLFFIIRRIILCFARRGRKIYPNDVPPTNSVIHENGILPMSSFLDE